MADALHGGTQMGQWSWQDIASNARAAQGNRASSQRVEFVRLVESARVLSGDGTPRVGMMSD